MWVQQPAQGFLKKHSSLWAIHADILKDLKFKNEIFNFIHAFLERNNSITTEIYEHLKLISVNKYKTGQKIKIGSSHKRYRQVTWNLCQKGTKRKSYKGKSHSQQHWGMKEES